MQFFRQHTAPGSHDLAIEVPDSMRRFETKVRRANSLLLGKSSLITVKKFPVR
jgi:hypothetical protein